MLQPLGRLAALKIFLCRSLLSFASAKLGIIFDSAKFSVNFFYFFNFLFCYFFNPGLLGILEFVENKGRSGIFVAGRCSLTIQD